MNTVDWQHPIISTRTVKGVERRESRFTVTCGECGGTRVLKRADARKVAASGAPCFRCTQAAKGKLGYAATAQRYGKDFFVNAVRDRELGNPSVLNRAFMDILDHVLFIPYEREVECGGYLIDFVLYGQYAVEVNGGVHVLHAERDARKAQVIREQGYELLVLTQADIPDAAARVLEIMEVEDAIYA